MSAKRATQGRTDCEKLWLLCQTFVEDNKISCPESICQCDHVMEHACEFIEQVCDIVGYSKDE